MTKDIFEVPHHLLYRPTHLEPPRVLSGFSAERRGPTITQALELGYAVISQESESTNERFVLLRESPPIKIGKLRKENPAPLANLDLPWRSDFILYGLGVVSPCLHVGGAAGPYWTLLLTALFTTSGGAKQKFERLRHRLSDGQRSTAHEIIEHGNPFHPEGITVEYEPGSAPIAKTKAGLPEEFRVEAEAWTSRYALRSRLFLNELAIAEEFMITDSSNQVSMKLGISRNL